MTVSNLVAYRTVPRRNRAAMVNQRIKCCHPRYLIIICTCNAIKISPRRSGLWIKSSPRIAVNRKKRHSFLWCVVAAGQAGVAKVRGNRRWIGSVFSDFIANKACQKRPSPPDLAGGEGEEMKLDIQPFPAHPSDIPTEDCTPCRRFERPIPN